MSAIILSALTHNFKLTAISGCGIPSFMLRLNSLSALPLNTLCLLLDALKFIKLSLRPRSALTAENLFLRKQLALHLERKAKPQRAKDATRLTLVLLSRLFARRQILTIIKPDTFIRWHRQGIRLFWRWKSKRRGRPRIPPEVQQLIAEMAQRDPTWGEERIAVEFLLKLGIRVSPRTVRRYMPDDTGSQRGPSSQRWMTLVRNHAQGILACDFFVAITARFRVFYVFVVLEVGTRRIAHFNVTAHPTADWTLQQFREVITGEAPYRFVVHDRDSIYSPELDSALKSMGMRVLKTPSRAPQANAFCERLMGTIRRECLDFLIPLNERHMRRILKEWGSSLQQGQATFQFGTGNSGSSRRSATEAIFRPSNSW